MPNNPKPHYVYIEKRPDGDRHLKIVSIQQEVQEMPLTFDLAMKFAHDFTMAAMDLHKRDVTRAGNDSRQLDLLGGEKDAVQTSNNGSSDNSKEGDLPTVPTL